jgi:cell fate (sporulation/competence/biofilm development) regulator YlbF (YheA/YmcA/DUF963 family)
MPLRAAAPAAGNAMTNSDRLPPELEKATDDLIQNLLASEAFRAYQKSRAQYKSDSLAHSLIEQLSALQTELRRKQINGNVTQADIEVLGSVQAEVQANVTLIAYTSTQQAAASFLRGVNQEISQLLGVNFASLAKQSNCC